ncbi:PEP-CTERM sorting domain-containing protein [Vibrio alfacsensis]|uniref:PEP-CTERM sorting domain-containing protein n=1 Tax=Vibrio alfacsensis TaxID=1074311 RepID=A0ABN5PI80_9VIBR|nr:PEP-CTERM sorting domain-containing protein [Vibrio alfacsensis]AXY02912.1 PEP-CTERM sorting domain-containing protein [Vibrio alfacsensis]
MKSKLSYLVALFLISVSHASATVITAELTNTSGNSWQAEYAVENNTLGASIEEFTIWFDLGLYENISVSSTPSSWDPLVVQPDPGIPDDGFYDVLALGSGISSGSSLDGFAITFDWIGGNSSMSQLFEVVDPNTWAVLDSGNTIIVTTSIPEPSSIILLLLGIAGLALSKKKQSKSLIV